MLNHHFKQIYFIVDAKLCTQTSDGLPIFVDDESSMKINISLTFIQNEKTNIKNDHVFSKIPQTFGF